MAAIRPSTSGVFSPAQGAPDSDFFKPIIELFHLKVSPPQETKDICFKAVIQACKGREWDKLKSIQGKFSGLVDSKNRTVFFALLEEGSPEVVESFLNQKGFLNTCVREEYNSAVHLAVRLKRKELIPCLAKYVNLNNRDKAGKTALHEAIIQGQPETVQEILKTDSSCINAILTADAISLSPLALAVSRGQIACIDILVAKGKTPFMDAVDGIGNLLHVAVHFGQSQALRHLLAQYFSQLKDHIDGKSSKGQTPLHLAAFLGDVALISALAEKGASFECQDAHGRTAMHLAAEAMQGEAIEALYQKGAKLKPADHRGKTPIDLVSGEDPESEALRQRFRQLKTQKVERKALPPEFLLDSIKNVAFQGGGPAGIAHIGVIELLYKTKAMQRVKRCAGSSAGGIMAAFAAMDLSPSEIFELLGKTPLTQFLDHPFTQEKISKAIKNNLNIKTLWEIYQRGVTGNIKEIAKAIWNTTGFCEGEILRQWLDTQIEKKTLKYCTFKEWRELIEKGVPLKHLHIFAVKIGPNPELYHFSSEDPRWDDLIISDGLTASASIPGAYKPHILHFKDSSVKGAPRRYPRPDLGACVDGGTIYNLPVETFDERGYLSTGLSPEEKRHPEFNPHTLGISLYSSCATIKEDKPIETVGELIQGILTIYDSAGELIRKSNPYNDCRILRVDKKDVGLLSFNIPDKKKLELVESGKKAFAAFFKLEAIQAKEIALPSSGEREFPEITQLKKSIEAAIDAVSKLSQALDVASNKMFAVPISDSSPGLAVPGSYSFPSLLSSLSLGVALSLTVTTAVFLVPVIAKKIIKPEIQLSDENIIAQHTDKLPPISKQLLEDHQKCIQQMSQVGSIFSASVKQHLSSSIATLRSLVDANLQKTKSLHSLSYPALQAQAQATCGQLSHLEALVRDLSCLENFVPSTETEIVQEKLASPKIASNNCWLNAFLQMNIAVPSLTQLVKKCAIACSSDVAHPENQELGKRLSESYTSARKHLFGMGDAASIQDFRCALRSLLNDAISLDGQEDVHEVLSLLMSVYERLDKESSSLFTGMQTVRFYKPISTPFSPDSSQKGDYSVIGGTNTVITSQKTHEVMIDLQGKEGTPFDTLLHDYFDSVSIAAEEAVYLRPDHKLQKFALTKEQKHFKSPPTEFFLTIKRYGVDQEGKVFKISTPVSVPQELTLPHTAILEPISKKYHLSSFIAHQGESSDYGHYIAYRKAGDIWIECNDSQRRNISNEEIDAILQGKVLGLTTYLHHYK